ncbi:MAG TPA: ice-binding family protein [Chthoniobacterales bacterium]|nr:ice-binding family protein [Chthoniobacterales bacterium]
MNTSNKALFVAVLATAFSVMPVKADIFTTCGIDLGAAGRTKTWAVFTLLANEKGKPDGKDEFHGSAKVLGDVAAAGSGNVKLSGNTMIQGDIYSHQPGKVEKIDKGRLNGSVIQNDATDTLLEIGSADALRASTGAANLATSPQFSSLKEINLNDHKELTIMGDGCTVLSLKNFKLSGDSVLTLTGDPGTAFVINVKNDFKLSGDSRIVLAGGLTPADVLFNVIGSGGKVELSGKSMGSGILLAARREVKLTGSSMWTGEVIARKVHVHGKIIGAVTPTTNP